MNLIIIDNFQDAIGSISRWAFIKASFPHILHACAASLVNRNDNYPQQKLGKILKNKNCQKLLLFKKQNF